MIKNLLRITALTSALIIPLHAANITVVAPNANTTTAGSQAQYGLFNSGNANFQWLLGASQFSAVPIGSQVTSIGFRFIEGPSNGAAVTFPQWNLQLSSSLYAVGSLTTTFNSNVGPDAVSVRSGPLTIPAGSFQGPGLPSYPFFLIALTTPYTYTGNDLLATLSITGAGNGFAVDAAAPDGIGDTVGVIGSNAAIGRSHFFNYPITEYVFSTPNQVPEPSTCALFGSGLLGFLALTQRRRR